MIDTLNSILPAWRRSLAADNRAPTTVRTYILAASQLHDYLAKEGLPTNLPEIEADGVRGFIGDMLARRSSSTARQRYASLRQCFKWLVAEGIIEKNPMDRVRSPRVVEPQVPVLTDEEIGKLIAACQGSGFDARRDEAIIRLFNDCGLRLSELADLKTTDFDLDEMRVTVMGKGSKKRTVGYAPNTAKALDRYIRVRRDHRDRASEYVWLGGQAPRLSDSGVAQVIRRRSKQALGFQIHAHQFRHTAAHRWLIEGGGETDLMRNMGWSSPQMLLRYGNSAGQERALAASRRMALGNRW
jgi:site-specific recombinase XerD